MAIDESENKEPEKHCLPRSSGIDENKAKKMREAIKKIFDEHQVGYDPKTVMALAYSTDLSD